MPRSDQGSKKKITFQEEDRRMGARIPPLRSQSNLLLRSSFRDRRSHYLSGSAVNQNMLTPSRHRRFVRRAPSVFAQRARQNSFLSTTQTSGGPGLTSAPHATKGYTQQPQERFHSESYSAITPNLNPSTPRMSLQPREVFKYE